MKDVQAMKDDRNIHIDKVGIKDINYPIIILDKYNKQQPTVASFNMYVDLPKQFKGTHMSRFVEILNEYRKMIHVKTIPDILKKMEKRFDAKNAHLEIRFPYFIEKSAPVSKIKGIMEYPCYFSARSSREDGSYDFVLGVSVPIMTLCPCSKEISRYGAHNQRGRVDVAIRYTRMIWIEDLVELVEASVSSPVYSVLKRTDERYVTEHAYDNPRFVEDVVREVAGRLNDHEGITWYSIEVENFESIHNHSAYASLELKGLGTSQ